jgi:hypothetical protein
MGQLTVTHTGATTDVQLQLLQMRVNIKEPKVDPTSRDYEAIAYDDWSYSIDYSLQTYYDIDLATDIEIDSVIAESPVEYFSWNGTELIGCAVDFDRLSYWTKTVDSVVPYGSTGSTMARRNLGWYAQTQSLDNMFNFDDEGIPAGDIDVLAKGDCNGWILENVAASIQTKDFSGVTYKRAYNTISTSRRYHTITWVSELSGSLYRGPSVSGGLNGSEFITIDTGGLPYYCLTQQSFAPRLAQGSLFIEERRTYVTIGKWQQYEAA